jgi:Variant SH3 domain
MTNPNAKARVQRKYAQYRDPIQVKPGDSIEVEREDDEYPGWLWCRATDGRQGWMPVELLSGRRPIAIALGDYSAKELTVQPGDELEIETVRHTLGLWSEMLGVNSGGSRNPTYRGDLPACFLLPVCATRSE